MEDDSEFRAKTQKSHGAAIVVATAAYHPPCYLKVREHEEGMKHLHGKKSGRQLRKADSYTEIELRILGPLKERMWLIKEADQVPTGV